MLAQRTARTHAGTPAEIPLGELAEEIAADRRTLIDLQHRLGLRRSGLKAGVGWLAQKLALLKLSPLMTRDTALGRFLELESLSLGIAGKLALWDTLADSLGSNPGGIDLRELVRRGQRQRSVVEYYRLADAKAAFAALRAVRHCVTRCDSRSPRSRVTGTQHRRRSETMVSWRASLASREEALASANRPRHTVRVLRGRTIIAVG